MTKKATGGGGATALGLLEALIFFSDLDGICPWKKIVRLVLVAKAHRGASSQAKVGNPWNDGEASWNLEVSEAMGVPPNHPVVMDDHFGKPMVTWGSPM